MNWDAIGAIAELLGAVAVVVTLIYLAVQVRQNTVSNQNTASQTISNQYANWLSLISENESVAEIYRKAQENFGKLSDTEKIRYGMLFTQLCRASEAQYRQYQTKAIAEEMWTSTLESLVKVLARPGGTEWWGKYGSQFTVSFYNTVSRKLNTGAPPPNKSLEPDA